MCLECNALVFTGENAGTVIQSGYRRVSKVLVPQVVL